MAQAGGLRRSAFLVAALAYGQPNAAAQERVTPEVAMADDPFEITDPRAAPPGEVELALSGSWERARRGPLRDTGALETELELGLLPQLEVRVAQAGAYGNLEMRRNVEVGAERAEVDAGARWGGATRVGALYQMPIGGERLPEVALQGLFRSAYATGEPSYELDMVALVGGTLRAFEYPIGLHLNVGWTRRLAGLEGERSNRYALNGSVGIAPVLGTVLVATYLREQAERGERDFSMVQAGVRHRIQRIRTILGLALGVGTNADSPAIQVSAAVQTELGGGP